MIEIEQLETISGGGRFAFKRNGGIVGFKEVIEAWMTDEAFRTSCSEWFAAIPFQAYRWESPPVTSDAGTNPFEFVVLDSPALERPPDSRAFESYFNPNELVSTFPNLGRDAVLIAPFPADDACYTHLASFLRSAPAEATDALWLAIGKAMDDRINDRPVWLNTAGQGVPWLHIRLDDKPKYYRFAEYRKPL